MPCPQCRRSVSEHVASYLYGRSVSYAPARRWECGVYQGSWILPNRPGLVFGLYFSQWPPISLFDRGNVMQTTSSYRSAELGPDLPLLDRCHSAPDDSNPELAT